VNLVRTERYWAHILRSFFHTWGKGGNPNVGVNPGEGKGESLTNRKEKGEKKTNNGGGGKKRRDIVRHGSTGKTFFYSYIGKGKRLHK